MNRLSLAALSRFTIAGAAHADCLKANAGVPPGANMTDPKPPSYIDTTELDFKTLPPTRDPRNPNYPAGDRIARRRAPASGAEGNFIIVRPTSRRRSLPPKTACRRARFTLHDVVERQHGLQFRHDPRRQGGLPRRIGLHRRDRARRQVEPDRSDRPRRGLDGAVDVTFRRAMWPEPRSRSSCSATAGRTGSSTKSTFFTVLDNLIHAAPRPAMVAISIGAGGQDAQGSERGLEYDAVSGAYAEWVESEVLPLVEQHANVRLTRIRMAGRRWASARAASRPSRWPGSIRNSITGCSPIRRRSSISNGRTIRRCPAARGNITAPGRARQSPTSMSRGSHVSKTDKTRRAAHSRTARPSRSASGSRPATRICSIRYPGRGRHA